MQALTISQVHEVSGGKKFHINLGHIISAAVVGFITGGPAMAGVALGGVIIAHAINGLQDLNE